LRAERVIHALDRARDGLILWTEFTAAAVCVSVCRNQRAVDAAFATLDRDKDGMIVAADCIRVFGGPDSEFRAEWEKRIPKLFAEAMATPVYTRSRITDKVKALFSSSGSMNRQQFRSFMGQKLGFRTGDAIYAVT